VFDVDLEDLRFQIVEMRKIGSVRDLSWNVPRLYRTYPDLDWVDLDRELKQMQGIIESMTLQERLYPALMTVPNRCLRIAGGAGVKPSQVSSLYTQFKAMRDVKLEFERGRWRRI
jgi:signal recognition particle subunit SRP54